MLAFKCVPSVCGIHHSICSVRKPSRRGCDLGSRAWGALRPGTSSLGPHGESGSPAAVARAHPEPSPSRLLGLELFLGERWMRQGSE